MTPDDEVFLRKSFAKSEILNLFGAKILLVKPGFFEMIISPKPFMLRSSGIFNGTTIAAMVDIAAGYATASLKPSGCLFATVELKINYLSPAMGQLLKAKASVIKNGKRLSVVGTEIYSIDKNQETHVATSLVTIMQLAEKGYSNQID